jgi:hypothetical protein
LNTLGEERGHAMSDKRQWIPVAGLLAIVAVAIYRVARMDAQSAVTGDFANAAVAEVRDEQGQVILRGQFVESNDDADDVERKAVLEPAGNDADAGGEAEVEISATAGKQELEFSVWNVQAGSPVTFVIDGQAVATATADSRGRAEAELEVTVPGDATSR